MQKADRKIVKAWVRTQGRVSRAGTLSVAFLGLLNVGAGMLQAWMLATFLAGLLLHQTQGLVSALIFFAAVSMIRILLGFAQNMRALAVGQTARHRLRHEILQRLYQCGPALLRQRHSNAVAELLVDRIEALEGYFSRWLPASFLWIAAQASVVLVLLWQNPQAGIILALCCLCLPLFQAVFGIATAVASRRQFLVLSRLQTRFLDRIKGIATLVLAGRVEYEVQALERSADELRLRTMRVLRIAFLASTTTDIAMIVALVMIVINQSVHLHHHISSLPLATKALFAVFLVPEAFAPFRALSAAYQDRAQAQAAAEAMHDLPDSIPDHTGNNAAGVMTQTTPKTTSEGIALKVVDLCCRWAEDRPTAVSNISFMLEPGEVVLLEGASGAGKSTLMELILGFVKPTSGQILLGGVDITALSSAELMRHISWIGQKPVLFAGTVRDNVLFARPEATEDELKAALDAAHVSEYLSRLPEGMDTPIGEGGFGLSGGQAQRIAVARAYLKNAPLLLLDEPTAHLDPGTETELVTSLQALLEGRTVLISTHSTRYDSLPVTRRLCLDHGRLVSGIPAGKGYS